MYKSALQMALVGTAVAVASTGALAVQKDWIVNIAPSSVPEQVLQQATASLGLQKMQAEPMLQPGSWRVRWQGSNLTESLQTIPALASALRSIPGVRFVTPNLLLQRSSVNAPTDPVYAPAQQSYMGSDNLYSMDLPALWERTRGSSQRIIAVLDSGILFDHPDLQGRALAGYDFVSEASSNPGNANADPSRFSGSNDGDGRDPDPSDPGDAPVPGTVCPVTAQVGSSFHGTSVASVAAAQSDNGQFVTGVDWNARILPVRVSGRCGTALISDIVDAIYWVNQSGRVDPLIPANPNKPDVINLSFAAQETLLQSCSSGLGEGVALAISDSIRAGVPIVVSAGNNGGALGFPASCPGAIAASAINPSGQVAFYSSSGQQANALTIYVPGDESAFYAAANNDGTATGAPDPNGHNAILIQGTSFSAPVVSGVVAMLRNARPGASFDQLIQALADSSRALPGQFSCDTEGGFLGGLLGQSDSRASPLTGLLGLNAGCGAGAINPVGALDLLLGESSAPLANAPHARLLPKGLDDLTLNASLSTDARGTDELIYRWDQLDGNALAMAGMDSETLQIRSGLRGNQAELLLTVTDTRTNQQHRASVLLVSADSNAAGPLTNNVVVRPAASQPQFQGDSPVSGPGSEPTTTNRTEPAGTNLQTTASNGGGGGGAMGAVGLFMLAGLLYLVRRKRCDNPLL